MRLVRRQASIYGALAAIIPLQALSYRLWFWVNLMGQILTMVVFVAFWRAAYEGRQSIGGLASVQTITYILMAQALSPAVSGGLVLPFGRMVREGQVAIELLRPTDLQGVYYAQELAGLLTTLVQQSLPAALVAILFLGLRLPTDPMIWICFAVSLLLGITVLFLFDWLFACLAFYTTETWGLSELRNGIYMFFSGALLPLAMLPGALRTVATALPFSQSMYVPVALLSGITPLARAPHIWLTQIVWIAVLLVLSRLVFRVAVRAVTVQGG